MASLVCRICSFTGVLSRVAQFHSQPLCVLVGWLAGSGWLWLALAGAAWLWLAVAGWGWLAGWLVCADSQPCMTVAHGTCMLECSGADREHLWQA